MSQLERWVIRNADGVLITSFKIDTQGTTVGCRLPGAGAPIKTKYGWNGPLTFRSESEAQALLTALTVLVSTEYADATVISHILPTTE